MAKTARYHPEPAANAASSTDALFAVGIAADALANSVGVAIESGYSKNIIGEKISQPLLQFTDRGGRFGRMQLDRCNISKFAVRLAVMPVHPNAEERDPEDEKELILDALARLDVAAEQRVADQATWDACNPVGNYEARKERLANMARINAQEMVQRAKLMERLNGGA